MFWRFVFSAAALVVAGAGWMVAECFDTAFDVLADDPVGVCATVIPLGSWTGMALGGGLVLCGLLSLVAVWVPAARRGVRRRRQELLEMTLVDNLSRLSDVGTELADVDRATISTTHATRLTRRLEAVEHALSSETVPAREASHQWISLLREANDLHNQELLATEDFRPINTRLLDLFSPATTTSAGTG